MTSQLPEATEREADPSGSNDNTALYAVSAVLAVVVSVGVVAAVILLLRRRRKQLLKCNEHAHDKDMYTKPENASENTEQSGSSYAGLNPTAESGEYMEISHATSAATSKVNAGTRVDYENVDGKGMTGVATYVSERHAYENMAQSV